MDARSRRGTDTRQKWMQMHVLPSKEGRRYPKTSPRIFQPSLLNRPGFSVMEWLRLALPLLLLLRASIHPNPGPITIMQWNCNGLQNKIQELENFLPTSKIDIADIQETKLTSKSKAPKVPDYTTIRQDRGTNKGGGLLLLVHKNTQFQTLDEAKGDRTLELQAIKVIGLKLANFYLPPTSSCPKE